MAKCPFAINTPISGTSGAYTGGPFKIVHHTTEGSSAAGAMEAFRKGRSDPHFTVDGTAIYQHIDTGTAARALRNDTGGRQTNRDSAVQIELVGFAGKPKNKAAVTNLARLCRWIEQTHSVPRAWPNGPPKPARNGGDPGGHNRNAANWDTLGGHYGHCHVPENVHWDPAYTTLEAEFMLSAAFDPAGQITNKADPKVKAYLDYKPSPGLRTATPSRCWTMLMSARTRPMSLSLEELQKESQAKVFNAYFGSLSGILVPIAAVLITGCFGFYQYWHNAQEHRTELLIAEDHERADTQRACVGEMRETAKMLAVEVKDHRQDYEAWTLAATSVLSDVCGRVGVS